MRSIKEQRELMPMAERGLVPFYMVSVLHAGVLDWAERVRPYLQGLLEHMEDEMVIPWEGVTEDDLRTLLEELPEE